MKCFVMLLILTFVALLLTVAPTHAYALNLPFAGKVEKISEDDIVCRGEGPITISPIGLFSLPGLYVIQFGQTKRYKHYTVRKGSWIIGLYDPIPSLTSCFTDSIPPVPVPVFPTKIFGSSPLF